MKKIFIFSIAILLLATAEISCNKSISGITSNVAALNPTNEDLNAGNWKTVLLTRPDTFAVAAPTATNSASYLADLNEIKGYQQNLSGDDKQNIKYWSAGGVLRWNEIIGFKDDVVI